MKAVIYLDVPNKQIGQDASIYFPGMTVLHGKCKAIKRPERLIPCTCGCKRRENWYGRKNTNDAFILKCCKCGFRVSGISKIDVHKKWNEAINEKK